MYKHSSYCKEASSSKVKEVEVNSSGSSSGNKGASFSLDVLELDFDFPETGALDLDVADLPEVESAEPPCAKAKATPLPLPLEDASASQRIWLKVDEACRMGACILIRVRKALHNAQEPQGKGQSRTLAMLQEAEQLVRILHEDMVQDSLKRETVEDMPPKMKEFHAELQNINQLATMVASTYKKK